MRKKIKREGKFYVYIVECSDGTYYTGYTSSLERRINEHNNSCGRGAKYLRGKTPVKLAYVKEYGYFKLAMQEEYRIKNLRRRQKEKLIRENEERE